MGASWEHGPARRTWRRDKDEPGKPNAPAQSHSGRKTTRPTSERSDIEGVWGNLPPAAWATTALDVWRWQPHTSRGQSSSMLYQSCTDWSGDCGVDISLSLIPLWPRLVCVAHALWPGNDARGHRQASFELILWSCTAAQLFPLLSLPSCVSVLLRVERLASSVLARTLIRCLVHAPS